MFISPYCHAVIQAMYVFLYVYETSANLSKQIVFPSLCLRSEIKIAGIVNGEQYFFYKNPKLSTTDFLGGQLYTVTQCSRKLKF